MAYEFQIPEIGEREHVFRPFQQREKGRRLIEQLRKAFTLFGSSLLGQRLLRRFRADHEHATDIVGCARLVYRAVAVGPVDILQRAVADDGHELVFVPRRTLSPHDVLDLRTDDRPDFGP